MMRVRLSRALGALGVAVASAGFALGVMMAAPAANAQPLSNGLDVSCKAVTGNQLTCVIGGCPRVNGPYVVDAVHVMDNGYQTEYGFKCINGETATHSLQFTDTSTLTYTLGFQACRKKDLESDWCGPWADYTYKAAPVAAPPPAAPPPPPAPAPKPDIQCPAGSPTPTVPAGQSCAPIPDVTNAIQASFGAPGATSLDFNVTNTSNIEATCNYTATASSLNPLVPKKTTRQFNVPANGTHTETFNGTVTFSTYNAVLSCKDASGKQKAELGHVETSVTW